MLCTGGLSVSVLYFLLPRPFFVGLLADVFGGLLADVFGGLLADVFDVQKIKQDILIWTDQKLCQFPLRQFPLH